MSRGVFALASLITLAAFEPIEAQTVRRVDGDRVTVRAVSTPAGDLLAELLKIEPIKAVGLEPKILNPVTVTAENVTPLQAIALVLKATEFDFVLAKTLVVSRTRRVVEVPKEPPRQYREPDIAERPVSTIDPDAVAPPPPPQFPVPQM
jgi:hypothetical protein